MTEITRCNRIGFHYNGFLNVLDNSNPAYSAKSSIKIFKKIYFCSNCGTWVKSWKKIRLLCHCVPRNDGVAGWGGARYAGDFQNTVQYAG